MNLQSGNYYWPATLPEAPTYQALDQDLNCDVLIVGGGISAAQCAYYLADTHLDVVVIEREKIGSGSTSANSALLQYSGEKMFSNLINTFGKEYIDRHLYLLKDAINEIEIASQHLEINSEFNRRDTLYYASSTEDVEKLKNEYDLLKLHNFKLSFLTKSEIESKYGFSKEAAIYTYNEAEINPFKFTHGLFSYAVKRNTSVYENTEMNGHYYDSQSERMIISTKTGHKIYARRVIFATGYDGIDIKQEKKVSFVSTYTVTTNPVKDFSPWFNRTLIWETARPYIFMRTTEDNRIIVGGLDENTTNPEVRDSKLISKKDKLIHALNTLFPNIKVEPEFYSAGFYGRTVDGLPIVGIYEEFPECYFLYGFGDNGTVYSQMLAKIITKEILDGNSPDIELYLQNRPLIKI